MAIHAMFLILILYKFGFSQFFISTAENIVSSSDGIGHYLLYTVSLIVFI